MSYLFDVFEIAVATFVTSLGAIGAVLLVAHISDKTRVTMAIPTFLAVAFFALATGGGVFLITQRASAGVGGAAAALLAAVIIVAMRALSSWLSGLPAMTGHDLQHLQRRRKQVLRAAIGLGVLLLLVSDSAWRLTAPSVYVVLQSGGFLMILLCIAGRTWCTLYIGGYKKRELITKGPYSIVRNPLYAFTIIGAIGVGLLAGSVVIALVFGAVSAAVFAIVAVREEAFLASSFGETFAGYAAKVARFWPRFSNWQEADELVVTPRLVRRSFLDASLLLLALPLMKLREIVQQQDIIPWVVHLP